MSSVCEQVLLAVTLVVLAGGKAMKPSELRKACEKNTPGCTTAVKSYGSVWWTAEADGLLVRLRDTNQWTLPVASSGSPVASPGGGGTKRRADLDPSSPAAAGGAGEAGAKRHVPPPPLACVMQGCASTGVSYAPKRGRVAIFMPLCTMCRHQLALAVGDTAGRTVTIEGSVCDTHGADCYVVNIIIAKAGAAKRDPSEECASVGKCSMASHPEVFGSFVEVTATSSLLGDASVKVAQIMDTTKCPGCGIPGDGTVDNCENCAQEHGADIVNSVIVCRHCDAAHGGIQTCPTHPLWAVNECARCFGDPKLEHLGCPRCEAAAAAAAADDE